ncbi:MAG TPA: hypothetical protein PKD54_00080 [Pirellulaceae bacterium]|nr:hypothetical protein [Pirellulaceae bacterium]
MKSITLKQIFLALTILCAFFAVLAMAVREDRWAIGLVIAIALVVLAQLLIGLLYWVYYAVGHVLTRFSKASEIQDSFNPSSPAVPANSQEPQP